MSLRVTDNNGNEFDIKSGECISLELKHNVTSKGKTWRFIGDHLYDFANKVSGTSDTLTITTEQYEHLLLLLTKAGWQECRGL